MTPREGVDVCDMRACPFCHEADFDAVGLKVHLSSGHCEAYESTPSPARTVRLGSPHPAATAREEAFYEAALAYFESDKARMAAFTGEVFIEGPESAAIAEAGKRLGAARAAYAALALARSTGKEA